MLRTSRTNYSSFQDQEVYEHVSPQDTRPQDDEKSQVDDRRLDLDDDLKKAQRLHSQGRIDFDDEGFDLDMNDVFKDVEGDARKVVSAAADEVSTGDAVNTAGTEVNTTSAPVTTACISISSNEPITTISEVVTTAESNTPPLTTTITVIKDEDLTIAQTLMKMRSEKSKVGGVVMKEPSKTTIKSTVPPQKHDPKDKAKLKNKSFNEVQKAFDKIVSWIDSFVPMDFEVVKDKVEGIETRVEESSKRAGDDIQQEFTKKQKVDDDDKEKKDLKQCFKTVLVEEVAINAITLAIRLSPIIRSIFIEK
nr:hypothetical protein [Tanacetum cinerariifolium]